MSVRALAVAVVAATPALLTSAQAADEGPPKRMSTVGGELLGRSGTQVHDGPGVPELPDDLTAKSWIVADAETGEVLAARNAHWPLPPASTLKMLFADTLLPAFESDEVYRARPEDFEEMGEGSSAVGIADGRTYTVEDLWRGVFLVSGNDAVYALSAMNGGTERTVAAMNERAEELQAGDTHVVNPDGYDARGQTSSAYDLTLIARSGMQNPDFRAYAATVRAEFPGDGEGEDRESYEIQNTNRLLVGAPGLDTYDGIAGVKNGYTSNAGHTFTGVAERDDRVLLVTVMSPDEDDNLAVYREAADLLDWGFEAAGTVEPVGELVPPLSELPDGPVTTEDDGGKNTGEDVTFDGAAGSADGGGPASGFLVLGVTAGSAALLGAGAYLFHRRHPLPVPVALRLPLPARRRRDAPPD
ncbi:D-alanyl-D-alanine carboxypeptidase family protein [Streptomyces specialis]|uniref:D-alanyl-D-alanine carboxypeptidase family protein n=1 Tax=Streptomyces specialis TaxID=498367 RepID=UPI00099E935F|nr:serine hydrolase [Streptomyces specialis]